MFNPSVYQQAIFDFVSRAGNVLSLIIEAVAGSGKTTTIVRALELLPRSASVVFLAFNKAIAETLASRVPSNVKASTFHSLGMRAWKRFCYGGRYLRVDSNKVQRILWDMFPKVNGRQARELEIYGSFVKRLVSLGKNAGIGCLVPDEPEQWQALIEHHDLTLDSLEASEEKAISIAREVLAASNAIGRKSIDFDDMLYLPILNNIRFDLFDFVFVDESQDTNLIQQAILKLLVKPNGGRLIAVGDTHQAIYGFRGADAEAMKRLGASFQCETLPLSVSYRISKAVCQFAKKYVPHIETPDSAPEGKVEKLATYTVETFKPTDAVICRNVAPLVAMAYSFISKAIAVRILGREIGQGLITLIQKMEATGIDTLLEKLETYKTREVAKLTEKGREKQAEAITDKVECVRLLIDNLTESNRTISALVDSITRLFTDNGQGMLTLCTAHKSKGLEFPRVFILDFEKLMPSRYATKDWQIEQEKNLIYVAATRAMSDLFFIESGKWAEVKSETPKANLN